MTSLARFACLALRMTSSSSSSSSLRELADSPSSLILRLTRRRISNKDGREAKKEDNKHDLATVTALPFPLLCSAKHRREGEDTTKVFIKKNKKTFSHSLIPQTSTKIKLASASSMPMCNTNLTQAQTHKKKYTTNKTKKHTSNLAKTRRGQMTPCSAQKKQYNNQNQEQNLYFFFFFFFLKKL
jgi:hypothetical protein